MDLPIQNKKHSIRIIIVLWSVFISLIILAINEIYTFIPFRYIALILFITLSHFSITSFRRSNIVKAVLNQNIIRLTHKNKLVEIPLLDIIKITSGINEYVSYTHGLSTTYKVYLNKEYSFGNCLHFKFEGIHEVDPVEISEIKKGVNKNVC